MEPMSEKALTDTIYLEMKMLKEMEQIGVMLSREIMGWTSYGKIASGHSIFSKCSNYVGETIEDAKLLEMKGILLIGHIGKFIKLAAGVMNTFQTGRLPNGSTWCARGYEWRRCSSCA